MLAVLGMCHAERTSVNTPQGSKRPTAIRISALQRALPQPQIPALGRVEADWVGGGGPRL